MSKQRTGHKGRIHESTETGIPLSIIIPLAGDAEKLSLCIDSLQKIKKPFNKDYEVILAAGDESAARKLLSGMPGVESLLENRILRIQTLPPGSTFARRLRTR